MKIELLLAHKEKPETEEKWTVCGGGAWLFWGALVLIYLALARLLSLRPRLFASAWI